MAEEGMDAEMDRLKARFPTWNVRRGDGLTIATRNDRRAVSEAELKAGLALTLIADRYSATLEDQLLRQARIESELS